MKAAIALSLLALEAAAAVTPGVVSMTYEKRKNPNAPTGLARRSRFSKRADTISVPLGNAEVLYYANVTIGTPGQLLQMQLDTGSSDVWMTDSSAAYCKKNSYNCEGGTFTPASSSTYNELSTVFNITYVDGTGSLGHYFTDDFTIGGVELTNLEMGLATTTIIGTGIIGVCFAADEAVCSGVEVCNEYPSIMQDMVSQGKINSQAYSLWLDDLEAATGSILFGGIDSDKYTGDLVTVPILKDATSGAYTSFSVAWVSLTSGSTTYYSTETAAILDSGTTLTLLPDDVFAQIADELDVQYDQEEEAYLAPCSGGSGSATYDFRFGGSSGPIIRVPVSEFFIPLTDTDGNPATFKSGETACEFGFMPQGSDPILFGDTFLRSAYVVYDLANKEISMAQTDFNSTTSNVQVIAAGTNGVPNVSGTASAATVSQTATVNSYGVQSATATQALITLSGIASTASVGSATAAAVTTLAASTGGATAVNVPWSGIGGVLSLCLASMFALSGSCLIFL